MTDEQFTPLAERYMDTVFRVAYSYLRCRDDADDVTQDVLIQLYLSLIHISRGHNFFSWLRQHKCPPQAHGPEGGTLCSHDAGLFLTGGDGRVQSSGRVIYQQAEHREQRAHAQQHQRAAQVLSLIHI